MRNDRTDRGATLVELLVVMIIMGVLSALVVSAVTWSTRITTSQTRDGDLWADVQDASTQLVRDVNDASKIALATDSELTALVVRDDKCEERAWFGDAAAQRLTVTTKFYDQLDCSGPFGTKVTRFIGNNAVGTNLVGTNPTMYTQAATFRYYDTLADSPISQPVEVDRITRVEWTLTAKADEGYRVQKYTSGAAFTGRGAVKSGSGTIANAARPSLCLTLRVSPATSACGGVRVAAAVAAIGTKFDGVSAPILEWTDTSTPGLTQGWTVYRIANPEGTTAGTGSTWVQATNGYIADPSHTYYVDPDLQPGFTAQYVVVAIIPSGVGPTSAQVVAGRRPAAVTVTAGGGLTTGVAADRIQVTWTAAVGATGYDVFRDGKLADSVRDGATTSWTDKFGADTAALEDLWPAMAASPVDTSTSGFGHSHVYVVVPTNRWENRLTRSSDDGRLTTGSSSSTSYPGGARLFSASSAAAGAFTAPVAPANSATPNIDWSNTVTRSYSSWVGAGPAAKSSASRDRGFVTESHLTSVGFTALWPEDAAAARGDAGRPKGSWTYYQSQVCNEAGCGPFSGPTQALQRPAAPSCTTASATTRSMWVNTAPVPMTDNAYTAYDVNGGSGNPTNTDALTVTSRVIDQLTHSTPDTFTASAQNGSPANSGWSDASAACTGVTLRLGVAITAQSSNTRTVSASMSTENGSSSSLTLENVRTDYNVGSASWDPLYDGEPYTITARNSDGYNNVVQQNPISTDTVATPGRPATPTCSYASKDLIAPGSYTLDAVNRGVYSTGSDRSASGLGTGTYRPWVYSAGTTNSDGYAPNDKPGPDSYTDSCASVTVYIPVPATPSCIGGSSYFQNTGYDMTNVNIWPCATSGATSYGGSIRYVDSEDGATYTTVPSWQKSLGWFDASWGHHSDSVQIRITASNAYGTSAYSSWFSVGKKS